MEKRNAKRLKTCSEHLEAMIEDRTKDLNNSGRLAAIGATAGMVGHDIRNPLQAIVSDARVGYWQFVLSCDNLEE